MGELRTHLQQVSPLLKSVFLTSPYGCSNVRCACDRLKDMLYIEGINRVGNFRSSLVAHKMRPWLIWFGFILVSSRVIRSFSISQLLQRLQRENSFDYVLIVGETEGILPRLFSELSTPIILIEENSNITYNLDKHFSRNLLCVAFVDKSIKGLLEFYNLNLQLWNTEPLFLIMKKHTKIGILESFWRSNQLLNVLAIFEDFEVRIKQNLYS